MIDLIRSMAHSPLVRSHISQVHSVTRRIMRIDLPVPNIREI